MIQVLLDVSGYNNVRSFFPGFFSRDAITVAAYKYANIKSRLVSPQKLNLLLINRIHKRRFINGTKWIRIIQSSFHVCYFLTNYIEFECDIYNFGKALYA